jgi:hypothetical protein
MNKTEAYEQSYVAFLDILGFKEIVTSNAHGQLSALYETFENYVVSKTLDPFSKITLEGINRVGCNIVSDSIFLWTRDTSTLSFIQLTAMVNKLLVAGFMADIPLRGGIAKGPLTVKTSALGNTFFGLGLTTAYQLELKQAWSGCIIQHGLIEEFSDNSEFGDFVDENHLFDTPFP